MFKKKKSGFRQNLNSETNYSLFKGFAVGFKSIENSPAYFKWISIYMQLCEVFPSVPNKVSWIHCLIATL